MYAIIGCDTTSRPYGIGKVTVISKYAALSRAADVLLSAKADIAKFRWKSRTGDTWVYLITHIE